MTKNDFKIYIPKHMWYGIYKKVFEKDDKFPIFNFRIGEDSLNVPLNEYISKYLVKAQKQFSSSKTIPIFIWPISLIFDYVEGIVLRQENTFPKLNIIGPAFKTRDDVFLLVCKDRKSSPSSEVKFAPKINNITSSTLARAYNEFAVKKGADPIFNIPHSKGGWPYEIQIEKERDVREDNIPLGWHGIVAAGPELDNFINQENYQWITAVNLNMWICNKFNVKYLPRAVYCTLTECFQDEETKSKIDNFWKNVVVEGRKWREIYKVNIQNVNNYLPLQIPCTSKSGYFYFIDIAADLYALKKFLDIAYRIDGHNAFGKRRFQLTDLHVFNKIILWEIYRQYFDNLLIFNILKNTILTNHSGFKSKTLQDLELVIIDVLENVPNKIRVIHDDGDFIAKISNYLHSKIVKIEPKIKTQEIRLGIENIYNSLNPDIRIVEDEFINLNNRKRETSSLESFYYEGI